MMGFVEVAFDFDARTSSGTLEVFALTDGRGGNTCTESSSRKRSSSGGLVVMVTCFYPTLNSSSSLLIWQIKYWSLPTPLLEQSLPSLVNNVHFFQFSLLIILLILEGLLDGMVWMKKLGFNLVLGADASSFPLGHGGGDFCIQRQWDFLVFFLQ